MFVRAHWQAVQYLHSRKYLDVTINVWRNHASTVRSLTSPLSTIRQAPTRVHTV